MNFGEPSPPSVDTANGFMVEQVKMTPPPGGIGLMENWNLARINVVQLRTFLFLNI